MIASSVIIDDEWVVWREMLTRSLADLLSCPLAGEVVGDDIFAEIGNLVAS